MARQAFSPSDDSYVRDIYRNPVAGVPVRVFTARTGGTQVTDLVYVNPDGSFGSAVPSGVLVSDQDGLLPAFAGPDGGPTVLYVNTGIGGSRVALRADPTTGGGGGGGSQFTSVLGKSSGTVSGSDIVADTTVAGAFAASFSPSAVKTAAYTAAAGDLIPVDTTSAAVTVTLPTVPADKTRVTVKLVTQGAGNNVTVACGGSDVLNKAGGSTSLTLAAAGQAVQLQYKASGAIWYVIAADSPYGPGSDTWLKSNAAAFAFAFTSASATDTTTGLPTAAALKWPDGVTGAFTGTIDGAGNGYSGYTVTWAGATTKTVTVTGITYDSNGTAFGPTGLAVS